MGNCTIESNSADSFAGMSIFDAYNVNIQMNYFAFNTAQNVGGGLAL